MISAGWGVGPPDGTKIIFMAIKCLYIIRGYSGGPRVW